LRSGADGARFIINDEAGHSVFDHLGHRARMKGDRRTTASHGLDQDEAERLGPIGRRQEARRTAKKFGLLIVADLADVFDRRRSQQRADLGLEIVAIDLVDLGRNFQRHTALSRDPDRRVGRLLRRDAAEECEV